MILYIQSRGRTSFTIDLPNVEDNDDVRECARDELGSALQIIYNDPSLQVRTEEEVLDTQNQVVELLTTLQGKM